MPSLSRDRSDADALASGAPRAGLVTLVIGAAILVAAHALLIADVSLRGGAVVPDAALAEPDGPFGQLARWVAVHFTATVWTGYLVLMDGLLAALGARGLGGGSPARWRPRRFVFCLALSVPIWLWFDWTNFGFLEAWAYHGLPEHRLHRWLMDAVAFAAICPAMFLMAEVIRALHGGVSRQARLRVRVPAAAQLAVGAVLLAFPYVVQAPVGALTMFLAWIFLLDPVNRRLGGPSIAADWEDGRWLRTGCLAGGATLCGLLWESWNYWAAAKWTYDLPFLGPLEAARLFEMPVLGFAGYPAFGVECWVMFQTCCILARRVAPVLRVEPLPGAVSVL